ncbi:hypothetical protein E1281_28170, partial [Actinomadura sp. KC345]|uniref:FtsK/SpoIIIE domain-containing protein n=1 Tax=Actinomadura sp. KC345 TaxID=2530371 RepID=UPI0010431220
PETRSHLTPGTQEPPAVPTEATPAATHLTGLVDAADPAALPDAADPAALPDVPDLLDLLGTPVAELIGDEWNRSPHPTLIGVENDDDPVWVDIMGGNPDLPHGLILGLRDEPDPLLRTIVLSLALGHSPNVVNFAFVDLSRDLTFTGLGRLPHVATAVHSNLPESPLLSRLTEALEAERRRREAVLRAVHLPTWDAYQSAMANGRELEPLPALIVIIDDVGPFLDAQPDVIEPLSRLCEAGPAQGITFVFRSPNDQPPPSVASLVGWQITAPGTWGPGTASLHIFGQSVHPGFRPAYVALETAAPIVEAMRRRGPHANRLHWPDEPGTPSEPPSPPVILPESDVLTLNGAGRRGTFEETWALPPIEPRDPAIGYDPDGNVVTLYPLDISAGIPHGLIVGETAARQRAARNIALALAATYSPKDLTFAFAGLGEHALGRPLDLPHVAFSDDELLGRPERLQSFIDYLSAELDSRAASSHGEEPGLVVFADVSLTFPSSRPAVGETLLSAAQRGRALGVQLLVSSSTVEGTTIWNRFLPLLGWRVAAGRMPPSLQRVLGQANLPFPDERTAYLLAGGGGPRRLTLAPDPPESAVRDFARRATEADTDLSLRRLLGIDPAAEDESVMRVLRNLFRSERSAWRHSRHLVFEGTEQPAMARAAELYGGMLAALGRLAHGDVREVTISSSGHILAGARPDTTIGMLFAQSRGGVLLIHMSDAHPDGRPVGWLGNGLRPSMDRHGEDPVVVLCADADQVLALRNADPFFTDQFSRIGGFERTPPTDPGPPGTPAAGSGGRVRIGVDDETGEPVLLDFDTDRHLLISGPSGHRRATLARLLVEEIARSRPAWRRRIYILDHPSDPLPLDPGVEGLERVRSSGGSGDPAELVAEVAKTARRWSDSGLETYLIVTNRQRLLRGDPLTPLLPLLEPGREHGLHLVLSRPQFGFGEPPDPMVRALREAGSPALLMGHSGQEAELWDVPQPLLASLSGGRAVLARGDQRRLIRVLGS